MHLMLVASLIKLHILPSALILNRIARRAFPTSTSPISMGGPSGWTTPHHIDGPNVLHVDRVSSCDKRTSYVQNLQLLLTVSIGHVTIDVLPDDVLLLIFHFDRVTCLNLLGDVNRLWHMSWSWHRLVHVCQRWRSAVLASPNFLDLRLICGPGTRVELTAIWPPFPVIIRDMDSCPMPEDYDFDAAIVYHDRVCEIDLHLTRSQLQRLAPAMQEKFPALININLHAVGYDKRPAALSDGFLGGTAPRLQSLELESIPFPGLPNLLLTATELVHLTLWHIPYSWYISPEKLGACLAKLTNLKSLTIEFESPLSRPVGESRLPAPRKRAVLPALAHFEFKGVSGYLEDLLAWIDAPYIDFIWITLLHQLLFDIPGLSQLMRRTTKIKTFNEAHMDFGYYDVRLGSLPPTRSFDERSRLRISCMKLDWQLSSLVEAFTSFFPPIYIVEHLYIYGNRYWGEDDTENTQWLEVFHPFIAVKNLYLCKDLAERIASALQELVGEIAMDVLPSLENLFLEDLQQWGPVQDAIEPFVAARQLSNRPVVVSHWNRPTTELQKDC